MAIFAVIFFIGFIALSFVLSSVIGGMVSYTLFNKDDSVTTKILISGWIVSCILNAITLMIYLSDKGIF